MTFASEGRGGAGPPVRGLRAPRGGPWMELRGRGGRNFVCPHFHRHGLRFRQQSTVGAGESCGFSIDRKGQVQWRGGAANALGQRRAQARRLEGTGWASYPPAGCQRGLQGEGAQDAGTTTGP